MSQSRNVINKLQAEIGSDLVKWNQEFVQQLRATTPIQTGAARKGWVNRLNSTVKIGTGARFPLAYNGVPYSGILDRGSSRQAPTGIVEEALRKTRK